MLAKVFEMNLLRRSQVAKDFLYMAKVFTSTVSWAKTQQKVHTCLGRVFFKYLEETTHAFLKFP